jgi:Putative quorum-sensing-regulated virulence factor
VYEELALGRNQDEPKRIDIAALTPPPRILPRIPFGKYAGRRFEDINSGYLNWIIHNINDEHVLATARYHLKLRAGCGGPNGFA